MDDRKLTDLLQRVSSGNCSVDEALKSIRHMPSESLDFACIDHHRHLRTGFPEVVYGENKNVDQIIAIAEKMAINPKEVRTNERFNSIHQGYILQVTDNVFSQMNTISQLNPFGNIIIKEAGKQPSYTFFNFPSSYTNHAIDEFFQPTLRFVAQRNQTFAVAFTNDSQYALIEIDLRLFEIDQLRNSEPGRIQQLKHRAITVAQGLIGVRRVE